VVANAVHRLNAPVDQIAANVNSVRATRSKSCGTSAYKVGGLDDYSVGIRVGKPGWGECWRSDRQLGALGERLGLRVRY
jgi:hypothetical protein